MADQVYSGHICCEHGLRSSLPHELPADDVTLDFGGTFPKTLDARVAEDTFKWKVGHHTHAAAGLDGLVGYTTEHLGAPELGHGAILSDSG
ncbi:hypothetical protein D3C75_1032190 [compost metagenome]